MQATLNRVCLVLVLIGCASALIVLFLCDPLTTPIYPRCVFHSLTGLYCPGCGSLRSIHALLHGEWIKALRLNFFIPLVFIGTVAYGVVCCMKRSLMLDHIWRVAGNPRVLVLILLVLIVYGILRNIPHAPFNYLAP
jgi:hypothetical protein